eukprot:15356146-Ditylum_brightwellii.AAC.1
MVVVGAGKGSGAGGRQNGSGVGGGGNRQVLDMVGVMKVASCWGLLLRDKTEWILGRGSGASGGWGMCATVLEDRVLSGA